MMKFTQLDHVALHVADVERSCDFYERVLQLAKIPRPDFDFPGAWFRLGEHQELHLIGGRDQDVNSRSRGTHWAVKVDNFDEWEEFFQRENIPYSHRRVRPDGAYQMNLSDPDGHVIELCTDPGVSNKNVSRSSAK
jgi:catechol 2,3-dioxygenase-like lactoylglutathione lyase family enzyme